MRKDLNPLERSRRLNRRRLFWRAIACLGVFALFCIASWPLFVPWRVELARAAAAESQLRSLRNALDAFEEDTGRYPLSSEGLAALLDRPSMIPTNKWKGPYLSGSSVPPDLWGKAFGYRCPPLKSTNGFDLYSLGQDGVSKTAGDDPDDINSWDRSRHWSKHYEDAYDRNRRRSDLIDLGLLVHCAVLGVCLVVLLFLKWFRLRRQARQPSALGARPVYPPLTFLRREDIGTLRGEG